MKSLRLFALVGAMVLAVQVALGAANASDARTAATIQDRVFHARVFDHGQVQVAFADGIATLSGTVDNLGTKLDAERAAKKVEGVRKVFNNLRVQADDVSVRQMLEQARKEVATYYAFGIFDNVALEARGDKLMVSGQVSQPFKKTDLGNILSRVRGVATLESNLEVLPVSFYDDRLRLEVARALYNDPYFIHYATQAVPPIHIIVKNGNVTLEGVVANAMDRTRAEMAARSAGLSFSVVNNLRVEQA